MGSALERLLNNGGGTPSGAAAKYSTGARIEAARKLITNRAAVLNDICNPERKTMHWSTCSRRYPVPASRGKKKVAMLQVVQSCEHKVIAHMVSSACHKEAVCPSL